VRAFLAIPVLPPALQGFNALREQLVRDIPAVRWSPSASPHITLHFFARISEMETRRAVAAVQPVLRAQQPMTLFLHGLGSFPSATQPAVLWWGVDGHRAELAACTNACRAALGAAGFAVEKRPFRAHCTLGRPRRPWPVETHESWRRRAREDPVTPRFIADRAIVYQSLTTAEGAIHEPVEVLAIGTTSV
jgi:2'-5' RNA ligase